MHVTAISRDELEEMRRAFSACDVDNDGRIDVLEFSILLRSIFEEDPMFCALLSSVIQDCKKNKWVYFPDFLGILVRNRDNPLYEEIWHRFMPLGLDYGATRGSQLSITTCSLLPFKHWENRSSPAGDTAEEFWDLMESFSTEELRSINSLAVE